MLLWIRETHCSNRISVKKRERTDQSTDLTNHYIYFFVTRFSGTTLSKYDMKILYEVIESEV